MYFGVFYLYLMAVVHWTILPIRVDSDFVDTMRSNTSLADGINLVPFLGLHVRSVQVYGNFLMGVPFGVGLPFLVGERPVRWHLLAAALFAVAIEVVQLGMDLIYGFAYRKVDVNDILLVWGGAFVGYALLRVVATAYCKIAEPAISESGVWSHAELTLGRLRLGLR